VEPLQQPDSRRIRKTCSFILQAGTRLSNLRRSQRSLVGAKPPCSPKLRVNLKLEFPTLLSSPCSPREIQAA